ncbi:MAG: crcB [Bacilli bacterium]|nr:crcB [Bacilli bacterium]
MSVLALIIGGFIGTVLRYEAGSWLSSVTDLFPLGTLVINLLGCLFLGWFLTLSLLGFRVRMEIRLGLGTGLTGAFTTFSTFSKESVDLFMQGHGALAAIYVFTSMVGGLLLTLLGVGLAKWQASRRKGDRAV